MGIALPANLTFDNVNEAIDATFDRLTERFPTARIDDLSKEVVDRVFQAELLIVLQAAARKHLPIDLTPNKYL
jgi:hypothetical protein